MKRRYYNISGNKKESIKFDKSRLLQTYFGISPVSTAIRWLWVAETFKKFNKSSSDDADS